jgi:uncharacterized protein YecT (DUF1311 family)
MKRFLFGGFLTILLLLTACAVKKAPPKDPCEGKETTYDINMCMKEKMDALDAEMAKLIEQITSYSEDRGVAFLATQAIWLKYRETQSKYEASIYEGGTIQFSIYADCYIRLTKQRIEVIKIMIPEVKPH